MPISVSIIDNATPWLQRLAIRLRSPEVRQVAGRAGASLVREHLYALDRQRHRSHVSAHFYGRAARATSHRVTPDGAEVRVEHEGLAQRYFGGRIVPRTKRALTIPIDPRADGRRAGEFPDLFLWKDPDTGKAFLARGTGRGANQGFSLYYALVASVDQAPDPSVLPTADRLQTAVRDAVGAYIARIAQRGAA